MRIWLLDHYFFVIQLLLIYNKILLYPSRQVQDDSIYSHNFGNERVVSLSTSFVIIGYPS